MAQQDTDPVATMAIFTALTYDVIAATNSSPQTTEINAAARGSTLMKWVKIGLWQSAAFAVLGSLMEGARGNPMWPPVLGSGLGGVAMWIQYRYAYNCGMRSGAPGTEDYGPAPATTGRRR